MLKNCAGYCFTSLQELPRNILSKLLPQGLCLLFRTSSLRTCSLPLFTSHFFHPREIFPDLLSETLPLTSLSVLWPPHLAFLLVLITPVSSSVFGYNLSPLREFKFQAIRLLLLVSGNLQSLTCERDSVKTCAMNNEWNETFWMKQCLSLTLSGQRLCLLVCISNSSSQH